jgi:DNA (cytosine-5)-methyltransferase 1
MPLTHVDLFAGVGGFTLGLERTGGFDTRLLVDSDESAVKTFKRNRPRVAYWRTDLRSARPEQLGEFAAVEVGELDLLTAGPPCQGLSKVGMRQLDDPRNALLAKTAELIAALRPAAAILENVPALSWDGHSALFDEIQAVLAEAGYRSTSSVLEAWRFGVPQLRRRLFIFAVREDHLLEPSDLCPVGAALPGFTARELIRAAEEGRPSCPPGLSVEEAIGDLPAIPAGGGEEITAYTTEAHSDYQRARRESAQLLFNHRARTHSKSMLEKIDMIDEGRRNFELPDGRRLRGEAGEYYSQAYARLHRHGIAQTITTYFHNPGSGRFTHYRDSRAITVREAARFQSFDDRFMFLGSSQDQLRHVGNAVPPLLAEAIGQEYMDALSRPPTRDVLDAA